MAGDKASSCGALVLLNCFVSPFGNRVRIALKRKGLPYEEKSENLAAKSQLLLSSNPVHGGKVPVLLVGDKPVCESLVILEFIDEAFPGTGEQLLPAAPCARAHALEEGKKDMVAVLKTLEAELGGKPYFAGDALGYVDVALVPFAPWFLTYERFGGFSVAAECPAIAAWAERCVKENELVATSLPEPEQVFQFVCAMRKAFGLD
nr:unnamed protein product [Digitaria exilis]